VPSSNKNSGAQTSVCGNAATRFGHSPDTPWLDAFAQSAAVRHARAIPDVIRLAGARPSRSSQLTPETVRVAR